MQLLAVLLLLLNGDFSQGLTHWQADSYWRAAHGNAVVMVDNTAGAQTLGSVMCSDPSPVNPREMVLRGSADMQTRQDAGYVFVGARWYDRAGKRLYDDMEVSQQGAPRGVWRTYHFTVYPRVLGAASISFCFFGGGFADGKFKALVDNARWEQ